ncbi:MAG: sigma-70 family RNA polymerase sigma factor [Nocardioides sp.]|uniref:sigma-70 family RNA polymerase sigma factor n=1 Tax=Nocardioides sp. TaxID=35761 RepID=UPI0039E2E7C9
MSHSTVLDISPLPKLEPPRSRRGRETRTKQLLHQLRTCDAADESRRDELLERIVEVNMPVARLLARHYAGRGIAAEDLEQIGYLALVAATRRFDPGRANDFLSYVVPTIKGELRRAFRDLGWMVRPPRRLQELQAKIWAAEAELTQRLGLSPTPAELATEVEASTADVIEALSIDGCFSPTSLDADTGDEGDGAVIDRHGGPDTGYAHAEIRMMVEPLLARLSRRDHRIIELRFFHGWNQQRIGEEIGVTQTQVSRLISRIMADLRVALADDAA